MLEAQTTGVSTSREGSRSRYRRRGGPFAATKNDAFTWLVLRTRRRAERNECSDRHLLVQALANEDVSKDALDTLNFAPERLASEVFHNFKFGNVLWGSADDFQRAAQGGVPGQAEQDRDGRHRRVRDQVQVSHLQQLRRGFAALRDRQ